MDAFVSDDRVTQDVDVANWPAFSLAYYEPILRALRLLRVPEAEVEELAHSFLLKAAERNFLETFRQFRERQEEDGRRVRFRTYLYRSIQNHVHDHQRRTSRGAGARRVDARAAEALADDPVRALDPDALYALDLLHQAIQALRCHCERSGKPHFWVFFEETYLADEFRGRRARTRAELLQAHPGIEPQQLDNALTTAKRAFRRFIEEAIPRGLRDDARPGERFEEWMDLLRRSHASQFDRLHLAYRVMPYLGPDMSQAGSAAMVVDPRAGSAPAVAYEPPAPEPDDDELSILLGFYLERPLAELIDAAELIRYIPPTSPLVSRPRSRRGDAHRPPRRSRPIGLLTLVAPTPDEAEALAGVDLVGLLARLKRLAKQLHNRTDHAVPEAFSLLLYTLASVLGLVRCEVDLHTIGAGSLAGNIRWFLRQPWLDDRIRPLLSAGLEALGGSPPLGLEPAPGGAGVAGRRSAGASGRSSP